MDVQASPDAKPTTVKSPKPRTISLGQAQHDLGVQSREDCEREKYDDRISALLYTRPETPPMKRDPRIVLYGKNKADKTLVSQLLKDKGQTSYDWRIPLLQLEQHYKPSDHKATSEYHSLFRKIESHNSSHNSFRRVHLEPLRGPMLAKDVPEPRFWSKKSLVDHLADVIETQASQARISRALKPQHRGWSNVTDIADIIHHLFRHSETMRFITADVCNIALRFFYDHGMFTRVRATYLQMEAMRMDISTETFNIILRSTASHQDLHNFTFFLHKMIQRGFQPDEISWVSLLMAITSTAVRAVIVHKMKEKGMLEKPGVLSDVVALMVQHDLNFHLGNGHSFDDFLEHMDSRYGALWLSTSAGNSLLNESIKQRSSIKTLDLLDGLKLRGFTPNEISIDILLRKCLPSRKYSDAMEILHAFHGQFNVGPGRLVFETLFIQAWKSRMLNFSRVVWRLACIHGFVTFPMRKLVFRSVLAATSLEQKSDLHLRDLSRSQAFNVLAGRFVVGVYEPERSEFDELGWTIPAVEPGLIQPNIKRTHPRARMKGDLLAARKFRAKVGMIELLHQALDLDRKWASEGLWKTRGRHPDLQHGVHVEIESVNARKARTSL